MADPRFFPRSGPFSIAELVAVTGATLGKDADSSIMVEDVAPLDKAGASQISFFDNIKYVDSFTGSSAGACFVKAKFADRAPGGMTLLVSDDPYRCFARAAQRFYPLQAGDADISSAAHVAHTATIGAGCHIAPGAVIGERAEIGDGTSIGPNAVVGDGVIVGSNCSIGACSTLSHCLIGDRVIIHRGVHIGQDGFGFAMGRDGHVKVPQLGRVVIEEDVEIGSGTCIDRGTGPDTHIHQGAKIDNQVQIGHNVQIGRGAVIVAQVGIAGSTRIGDGAVLGGQVGIAGHLKIGAGARLAARAGVMSDIPAGAAFGGSPAVPVKDWHRQTLTLAKLTKPKGTVHDG